MKQAGVSTWFRNTHRGKRCIVLDLNSEAGTTALARLVDKLSGLTQTSKRVQILALGSCK